MNVVLKSALMVMFSGSALALTPALAHADNAQSVIDDYRSRGYQVIVDRNGTAPTSKCTVAAVRNERETERTEFRWTGLPIQVPDRRLVQISLDCRP